MAARKPVKKKTATKKTATRKTPAKKTTRAKTVAKKPAAKSKKAPVKKKATATKKRTTTRKTVAKKSTVVKKAVKLSVGDKAFTKSQFVSAISEQTGLSKKDVTGVLESISGIIELHLKKRGPESFSWPGMFKMKVVRKPATKARKGTNPFTGEPMTFKAKPASRKVKILALKSLKEMAN